MVSTITARFRCSRPPTDLHQGFIVLCALLFQYFKKLVEGMIRDLASPKPFHTLKVQRLKAKHVKLCAKFGSKFPLPIQTLSANFSMLPCQSTTRTIPIARTFDFTRKCLVQRTQHLQRLFEKLRRCYFITCVAGEEGFVSVIKPCTLTRHGFAFGILNSIARKAYPIVAAPVAFECDRLESSLNFAVFVEKKPRPYTVDFDTIVFKSVTRLCEGHRVVFLTCFDFRSTDFTFGFACFAVFDIFKKSVLRLAITQYNVLDNLTRQVCPMRLRPFFELGNVCFYPVGRQVLAEYTVIPTRQTQDMHMDPPHIVKHIAYLDNVRLRLKFVFIGFSHGLSGIRCLSPTEWEADT